jgi:hypothetical protein
LPITRYTRLVKNKVTGEKEVGKLLLKIPVRELHNNMMLPLNQGRFAGAWDEFNKVIISDTAL